MKCVTWALVTAGLVVIAGWSGAATGQAPAAQDQDVVAALLVEVRGLRTAMEQMAAAGPRVQLALGRLQLQEQRVNTLLRRHDDVKARIASEEQQAGQLRDELARLEERLRRETDVKEREALEERSGSFKLLLERLTGEIQRLQAEEIGVAQGVASERGRWMDINAQLEALERALGRPEGEK